MNRFQKLALSTTVATFALITWGGLVRATGSGDGCPDWPRCFGRWIPPLEYHALIEYTHRFLVNIVVVLIGIVAVAAFRRYRHSPRVLWPALAGVFLVLFQAVLGGIVVNTGLDPTMVTAHLAAAMLVIGSQVYLLVSSFSVERRPGDAGPGRPFARLAAATAGATFALLLVGAYVRGRGAGLAFRDWPLMDGRLVPTLGGLMTLQFAHRVLVAVVFLLVLYTAIRLRTMAGRTPVLTWLAWALVALFAAQIVVGALTVWTSLAAPAVVSHVALSTLIWCVVVAMATASARPAGVDSERGRERAAATGDGQRRSLRETTVAYVRLTKPRIIVLLLITTVPAMVLA
ncbi:MAG: COX15/CtaA family protein, partial [Actinobacteria bacterium]|nr:COX15/CtaA family protein [Actinomycetota bacterium]